MFEPTSELLFCRLFHSILNLRQVLQSSAHWLLLLDKSQYHHDQSKPFLQMVTSDPINSFTIVLCSFFFHIFVAHTVYIID